MCKPASFVVLQNLKVYQSMDDSHETIIRENGLNESSVRCNLVRVEISPVGGDLSLPLTEWKYSLDQTERPEWYNAEDCERECRYALNEWSAKHLSGWNVKEAFHPVNPFLLTPKKMTQRTMIAKLKKVASVLDSVRASVWDSVWDSVWASVRASVWDSVKDSVWDSVWDSVRDSVWDSVRASVRASVWAYTGGLFPCIKSWKYAEKLGATPWKPYTDLWYAGYVPSFDGKTWRLHCGKDAKIVCEWTPKKETV